MKRWWLLSNFNLSLVISIFGCLSAIGIQPGLAEEKSGSGQKISPVSTFEIPQLSEIELPAKSATMLAQAPVPSNPSNPDSSSQGEKQGGIATITGVKANPTEKGVEVILETTQGDKLQVTNRSTGNNFIADITGGQLRLPSGDAFTFKSENPISGITQITVTNVDANTVRVTVVGEKTLPTVELFDDNAGLIFAVVNASVATQPPEKPPTQEKPATDAPQEKPAAQQDEPIELVVTGEQDGYRAPSSSTATRTDTPLRDIPQSIQVVPQQVLRDQNVTRLDEALRNAPGVIQSSTSTAPYGTFTIRGFNVSGFNTSNFLRNGLRDPAGSFVLGDLSDIERIEVLKGPASVLYGGGSPGGRINLVTKQPLREPFYAIDATVGSYNFHRGAIDLSGPLNDSKTVLYRLNTSYLNRNNFIDFYENSRFSISPTLSLALGERTNLALEGDYTDQRVTSPYAILPGVGTVLPNPNGNIPRNRFVGEPDDFSERSVGRVGYRLEHQFSKNWSLQNAFRASFYQLNQDTFFPSSLADDNRTLNRFRNRAEEHTDIYSLTTEVIGKFVTGSINHQLVFGVTASRFNYSGLYQDGLAASLDLFNPVYRQPREPVILTYDGSILTDTLGIYLQNQVALTKNLRLVLGTQFDVFEQTDRDFLADTRTNQSGNAFNPFVGIVYQPVEPISLYASYGRSFTPTIGRAFDRSQFQPERGAQYEVGVKADLNDRLSATLALYELTRTNVLTTDTSINVPPGFSIQTGEQRSRGIELNVAGEIIPGWNIIAGYAYTDARITEDNTLPKGNWLNNVPENAFNLWMTYEIQSGNLRGLGVGLGLFFVGERQADLSNTFQIPSYLRTDATIYYQRERFRANLNFRNLFDINYFEASDSSLPVSYGEPFTLQGTISWQF